MLNDNTKRMGNMKKRSWQKICLELAIFIMAVLSSMALLGNASIPASQEVEKLTGGLANPLLRFVAKLRIAIPDNGLLGGLTLFALWLLYRHHFLLKNEKGKYFSKTCIIFACIFSVVMVTGMSFKKYDSFAFVIQNKFQIIYSSTFFIGFAILFYTLLEMFFCYIDEKSLDSNVKYSILFLDKHPFIGPFCFLLVCWLPYWLAYFPGSAMWDAFRQFNYYFGIEKWSDHHPVFSTIVYGGLMQLGRMIHSDNMGIFLCALFQHVLFGGSIALGLYYMKKWSVPQNIRIVALLFFGLCPIVAFWPHSVMKDVAFDALILIYSILVLDFIHKINKGKCTYKNLLCIGVSGMLASLMRHNGIYIVVASLAFLACLKMKKKARIKVALGAMLMMVCTTITSDVLIDAAGAVEGSSGLALSVPFQQTARYVKEHGEEVTEEEKEVINAVLNYDRLAERYDPHISDPIKGTYKDDDSKLSAYIKIWFQMFLKHPVTYLEATISNSYSYFYPNGESTTKPLVYNFITGDTRINTGYFDIHYTDQQGEMRNFLSGMLYVVKKTPGVGLICHMGTYTWLLLLLIALGIHKQRIYLVFGCMPAILNFLSCVASPVNGYLRYFLPNVLMIPILIGWFISELYVVQKI